MKVIIFGASGMVGQGVARECIADPQVEAVLLIGRGPSGLADAKLREITRDDLLDYADIAGELGGYDACFFCLGVSAAGMNEAQYTRITHDLTLAAAQTLVAGNPQMTFVYVSGAGTDSTERGRAMWARVKGKTENDLLRLPFAAAYMFRPGYIQPLDGIKSKTKSYRIMYALAGPLYPLWNAILPRYVTTTRKVGRAMLRVVTQGHPTPVLENADINALAT